MKGQVPQPSAGGAGPGPGVSTTYFSTGDFNNVFRFNPRSADDVFREVFGSSSPFDGMGSGGMRGSPGMAGMFGDSVFSFGGGGGDSSMQFHSQPRKASAIENQLPCSLEDLYKGTTKKMRISRELLDASRSGLDFALSHSHFNSDFIAIILIFVFSHCIQKDDPRR